MMQVAKTASGKPLQIALLAYPGMNLIDLSGPVQAFATACRVAAPVRPAHPRYQVRVFSSAGSPLLTGAGLTVMTEPLSALETQQIDTLIAPGGSVGETFQIDQQLVLAIQRHAGRARRVCSVCTGAFLLAATGLLDGKRVTTHWDWALRLQQQYPQIEVDPEPIFIRADKIWTSAGVTAGIDLTLALIEQDYGHGPDLCRRAGTHACQDGRGHASGSCLSGAGRNRPADQADCRRYRPRRRAKLAAGVSAPAGH